MKSGCNLGYACCGRLPEDRAADAVRFSLRERDGRAAVQYVFEIAHRPAAHGVLEFNARTGEWAHDGRDARLQRMAECFLQSKRQARSAAAQ